MDTDHNLAMKEGQGTISRPMTAPLVQTIVASSDRVDGGTTVATVIMLI